MRPYHGTLGSAGSMTDAPAGGEQQRVPFAKPGHLAAQHIALEFTHVDERTDTYRGKPHAQFVFTVVHVDGPTPGRRELLTLGKTPQREQIAAFVRECEAQDDTAGPFVLRYLTLDSGTSAYVLDPVAPPPRTTHRPNRNQQPAPQPPAAAPTSTPTDDGYLASLEREGPPRW